MPICSERAGRRIDKLFTIIDLKDANLLDLLNSDAKKFLKRYTFLSQNYYPELLEKLIIINAPFVFKGIWNIVKYWIDSKTRDKIDIYWGKGKSVLKKYIDEDKIP